MGALAPITNLDQFKDRETFTDEAKHLSDCMRLYEEVSEAHPAWP